MVPKYIEIYDLVQASPDEYLIHHGIKGQKWGVRRYQNKDGSLTRAGKKRLEGVADSRDREKPSKKKAFTLNQKVSQMSDEELRIRTERLRLENTYKQQYVFSKQGASFFKRYGPYLQDLSAASDNVTKLAKVGSKALKLIKSKG